MNIQYPPIVVGLLVVAVCFPVSSQNGKPNPLVQVSGAANQIPTAGTVTLEDSDASSTPPAATVKVKSSGTQPPLVQINPADPPGSEMTSRGRNLRGVYMPVGKVKTWAPAKMARELQALGANAVVMDFKDDFGRITFTNKLEMARGYPHGYIPRMKKMVHTLKDHDIYVIARVVCFKDNWFATRWKEVAIQDIGTKGKWHDLHNQKWVDPHSQKMRDHIVSVAAAAEALGVDEIQLDYVRFPVEPSTRNARYPMKKAGDKRYEVIAELLRQIDGAISIPLSADVFGLTAYHPDESERLGQYLEYLAPHLDAISPMVYLANWPPKYWENPKPEKTHQVIKGACARIRQRLGNDIVIRPLLQAFRWRAENWGYSFIKNQMEAAINGGADGHLFWNAGGRYKLVKAVWYDADRSASNDTDTDKPESDTSGAPK
ncbi:MAG: hypothetical protein JXX14_14745 [Deltaproteobacteria bacterium]|nr:hypothetical protein [Deltaproteobacteria bacterium]